MADHDPLCPFAEYPPRDHVGRQCRCDLIARVRADKQEQDSRRYSAVRAEVLADLRAEVEGMLEEAKQVRDASTVADMRDNLYGYGANMFGGGRVVGIAEVLYGPLALTEEGEHGPR